MTIWDLFGLAAVCGITLTGSMFYLFTVGIAWGVMKRYNESGDKSLPRFDMWSALFWPGFVPIILGGKAMAAGAAIGSTFKFDTPPIDNALTGGTEKEKVPVDLALS